MASTDARPVPRKNIAYRVTFPIFDADGDLVTGATGLDSEVSIDGGTFADCTNEATEIATSSGMYFLDLTSGEMNGDTVAIIVKTSSVGAKTSPIVMYPEELGDIRINPQTIWDALTAALTTADSVGKLVTDNLNATVSSRASQTSLDTLDNFVDTEVGDIKTKTDQLTFTSANKLDARLLVADDFAQACADKVWATTVRTLSAAGVQAIWDALTSALSTASSIGKLLVDNINATISSRASQTSVDTIDDFLDTEIAAIKAKTDQLTFTTPGQVDATAVGVTTPPTVGAIADAVWDEARSGHVAAGSFGEGVIVQTNSDKSGYSLSSAGIDAIWDETQAELTAVPTTASSLRQMLQWLFSYFRNRNTVTSSAKTIFREDASTTLGTEALTDDLTTFTKGEAS